MCKTRLIALLTMMSLSACAPTNVTSEWCMRNHLIQPSKDDVLTSGTQRQILLHDDSYAAYCS